MVYCTLETSEIFDKPGCGVELVFFFRENGLPAAIPIESANCSNCKIIYF